MSARSILAFLAALLAGCASRPVSIPANVSLGSGSLPAPTVAANAAPPRIIAMRFSSSEVRRGQTWWGRIVTTTNVASLEVRTNLFSIDAPRKQFGRFAFDLHVLDVPPIFVRAYRLRVIARNTAGDASEVDLPLRIR